MAWMALYLLVSLNGFTVSHNKKRYTYHALRDDKLILSFSPRLNPFCSCVSVVVFMNYSEGWYQDDEFSIICHKCSDEWVICIIYTEQCLHTQRGTPVFTRFSGLTRYQWFHSPLLPIDWIWSVVFLLLYHFIFICMVVMYKKYGIKYALGIFINK
jgi:hypothetical protein